MTTHIYHPRVWSPVDGVVDGPSALTMRIWRGWPSYGIRMDRGCPSSTASPRGGWREAEGLA